MAIAIPMLLGYHPDESLVVSCMQGGAVGLTMRFDLAALSTPEEFADEIAERVELADADATFIAVFSATTPEAGALPYVDYVSALDVDLRVRLMEAVFVHGRRWWSYLCADSACCPVAGRPLDDSSPVATNLSAAFTLAGSSVLAGREALVRTLGFDAEQDVGAARRRMSAARRRVAALDQAGRVAELRGLVDALAARLEDPRAGAKDAEIARLAELLHDVTARDELLVQAVPPGRREAILRVLRDAVRRVPPPRDAPLCTALAWFSYADGDGTVANIALDRALRSDPEYSLALLVAASLDRQLPPAALVDVMKGAARDLDARDAAG
jgi:hypothetical protein